MNLILSLKSLNKCLIIVKLSLLDFIELSEGIGHLFFKVLIELGTLDKAISEAGFLVSQKLTFR